MIGVFQNWGVVFPRLSSFWHLCFAVYNTYMHLCYVCICCIIHTESTVNGRSDSTISKCWWLSPPRRGHRSGWYPPVSSNMAMSRKSTLIIFPSRNLHLSPFIIIHRGFSHMFHGFGMVFPGFSHGFPMVFPSINLHGSEISQPRYDDTRIRPWNKHNIRLRKDGASLGAPGWTTSWFRGGYRFFLRIFCFYVYL